MLWCFAPLAQLNLWSAPVLQPLTLVAKSNWAVTAASRISTEKVEIMTISRLCAAPRHEHPFAVLRLAMQ
jgi:hypothetical protein